MFLPSFTFVGHGLWRVGRARQGIRQLESNLNNHIFACLYMRGPRGRRRGVGETERGRGGETERGLQLTGVITIATGV